MTERTLHTVKVQLVIPLLLLLEQRNQGLPLLCEETRNTLQCIKDSHVAVFSPQTMQVRNLPFPRSPSSGAVGCLLAGAAILVTSLLGCEPPSDERTATKPSEERFDRREGEFAKHTHHSKEAEKGQKRTHDHDLTAKDPRWYITMHGKPAGNTVHGINSKGELLGSVLGDVPESAGGEAQGVRGMLHTGRHGLLLVSANMSDTRILWYGSPDSHGILPFSSTFAVKRLTNPEMVHSYALAVGIDGTVFASNQDTNTVTRYSGIGTATPGQPIAVPPEIAGLGLPPGTIVPRAGISPQGITEIRGIAIGADGLLYVADRGASQVLAFDCKTGLRHSVVASASQGLRHPIQLLFAPDGETLYISDNGAPAIFRTNVRTGEFILFANARTGCPELPSSLAIDDTHLYVGDRKRMQILRFNIETGERSHDAFVDKLPDAPEFMIPASVIKASANAPLPQDSQGNAKSDG